jgi:hypothetical protein
MVKVIQGVSAKLGIDCVPVVSHQGGPEPTQDYVSINTLRMYGTGRADSQNNTLIFKDGGIKQYSVQNYEVDVQLMFVGNHAGNNATTYHSQYYGNTSVREIYTKNNLAVRRITGIRRVPQLRENVWVNAFSFDVTLGFAVRAANELDWADYITVNGKTIPLI